MTERERVLDDLEIENGCVVDLLYDDFNAYQENFDASGDDNPHQDLRASFLSWTMMFVPEIFPPDLELEIVRFVNGAEERGDYEYYGWHNTLHLRTGLFALTRDDRWLRHAIANLSHDSSSLRRYVARTIAPVIDLVSCEDLEAPMRTNLEKHHFFNVYPLTLFMTAARKRCPSRELPHGASPHPARDCALIPMFEWMPTSFSKESKRTRSQVDSCRRSLLWTTLLSDELPGQAVLAA